MNEFHQIDNRCKKNNMTYFTNKEKGEVKGRVKQSGRCTPSKSKKADTANGCSDPPRQHGPCKAYNPMWTFEHGECQRFIYGGCMGNRNRFITKKK